MPDGMLWFMVMVPNPSYPGREERSTLKVMVPRGWFPLGATCTHGALQTGHWLLTFKAWWRQDLQNLCLQLLRIWGFLKVFEANGAFILPIISLHFFENKNKTKNKIKLPHAIATPDIALEENLWESATGKKQEACKCRWRRRWRFWKGKWRRW